MGLLKKRHLITGFQIMPVFMKDMIWNQILRREVVKQGIRLVPEAEFSEKLDTIFAELSAFCGPDELGDYLEFGVYTGTSLGCAFQALQNHDLTTVRLFGFDSFDGLPPAAETDDEGTWYAGQFKSTLAFTRHYLEKVGIDWKRTFLIKGFFCDSLTERLKEKYQLRKASVIMIDCDMYLSTKEALEFCEPLIRDDCFIIFDDWHTNRLSDRGLGEKKAFDEFLEQHNHFVTEQLPGYNDNSVIFRIRRLP